MWRRESRHTVYLQRWRRLNHDIVIVASAALIGIFLVTKRKAGKVRPVGIIEVMRDEPSQSLTDPAHQGAAEPVEGSAGVVYNATE